MSLNSIGSLLSLNTALEEFLDDMEASGGLCNTAFCYNDGGRAKAGFKGRCGDCAVRAVAIATDQPYDKVYADLRAANAATKAGAKSSYHRSPRHGVFQSALKKYMLELGWHWTPTMGIGTGCNVHLRGSELPRGRLLVRISKHIVAVLDGVINDTHDCSRGGTRCVYGYWSKKT